MTAFDITRCDQFTNPIRRAHCRGETGLAPESLAMYRARLFNLPLPAKPLCGTAIKRRLADLGQATTIEPVGPKSCGCQALADEMDRRGPQWCRDHRGEIAAKIKKAADERGWAAKLKAGVLALRSGIALHIDLADPYGWLVDDAIKTAEELALNLTTAAETSLVDHPALPGSA